jgi:hypothetical protein
LEAPKISDSKSDSQEVQPYQAMDVADEGQILAEMKGENFLPEFVYQFQQGGRTITSLSYTGIKEAIRRRGNYTIVDYKIEETADKYRAIVKIHDNEKRIDALGASEADKSKPFAYVLALNKAERNAYAKLIPAKYFAELIAEKLGTKRDMSTNKEVSNQGAHQPPKDVTPPPQTAEDKVPTSYQLEGWIKPEIYAELTMDEKDGLITLKPKKMLNTEDFKDACKVAEKFGGKWVKEKGVWEVPS